MGVGRGGGDRRKGDLARSLHYCKVARGYNARVRVIEGLVTRDQRCNLETTMRNERERKRETVEKKGVRREEEDILSRCDKSRDMTFSAPRDKSYRTRETFIRRKDLLGECPESTQREFSASFRAEVITLTLIDFLADKN